MKSLFFFALTLVLLTAYSPAQTCSNTFGVIYGTGLPAANVCGSAENGLQYVRTDQPGGSYYCQCTAGVGSWVLSNPILSNTQPPVGSTVQNSCSQISGTAEAIQWAQVPGSTTTYVITECYDTSNGNLYSLATNTCSTSGCTPPPTNQPTLSCTPTSLVFPATNTNSNATPQNVNCTNSSTNGASVIFSGATFTTGTNFSQTNSCGTLLPGANCSYVVNFIPTTTSTSCGLTDTLSITSNAQGSPLSVSVCGDGQTPTTPTPSSVLVQPASPTIAVGSTSSESASLTLSNGLVEFLTPYWNSATTSVATVNQSGVVTGVSAGTSVISANAGGLAKQITPAEINAGSGPTTTLTTPTRVIALASRILVAVCWGAATGSVSSVTDTLGNTFTAITGTLEQANSNSCQWWTATGSAAGGDAATVNFAGGGVAFPDIVMIDVVGDTAVDQAAVGTVAAGTSLATTAITPAQASEAIFSAVVTGNFVKAVNSGAFCITAGNSGQNGLTAACPVSPAGGSVFFQDTFSTSAVTPTATLNVASTGVISSVALKTLTGTTTATVNSTGASAFTLQNPPAGSVYPYIASGTGSNGQKAIFNQALTGNCYSGGCTILNHGKGNVATSTSDPYARYFATGGGGCNGTDESSCDFWAPFWPCGTCGASNSASSDSGVPIYYSSATDPLYVLNQGTLSVYFHAPQFAGHGPVFSNGNQGDQFVGIWDNALQQLITIYKCCTSVGFSLPASTCNGTGSVSCAANAGSYIAAMAGRYQIDSDYDANQTYGVSFTDGAGNSIAESLGASEGTNALGMNALGSLVRFKEMSAATINHAIQVSFFCGGYGTNGSNNQSGWVYPASSGLLACGKGKAAGTAQNANQPLAGQLFVCDYTSAQITAMTADPLQKAFLTACSKYGVYFTQTGAALFTGFQVAPGGEESQEAYATAGVANTDMATTCTNNPNFLTCTGTTVSSEAFGHIAAGIPKLTGPGTTDQEGNSCSVGGCFFSGHFHAIDACIVKTAAGVAGGC